MGEWGVAYILASAAATTWGAIEEVLLHAVAHAGPKLGRRARQLAVVRVACVRVVVRRKGAHEALALQVARRALPAGAGEALRLIAAFGAFVFWVEKREPA